jgi:xanthine dehydrogenase YagR molybdenum-binding subunit
VNASCAGADVIAKLAELAMGDSRSPLFGAGNAGVVARGGRLFRRDDESRSESYGDILSRAGVAEIDGHGKSAADPTAQSNYAMHAHGAVFAEVKVDPELGQIRVTRLVGAFAAGRVINPRLVRSQYYGGMIWGVSFALHEHAVMDLRSGRPMNPNLGEYHVPVNADVPSLEAILIDEHDPHVNALGIKGVGEIAVTGSAGAVANAVWHATGIRVRQFPITLDRLIEPALGERPVSRRRGDEVPVHTPRGVEIIEVLSVSYPSRAARYEDGAPVGTVSGPADHTTEQGAHPVPGTRRDE